MTILGQHPLIFIFYFLLGCIGYSWIVNLENKKRRERNFQLLGSLINGEIFSGLYHYIAVCGEYKGRKIYCQILRGRTKTDGFLLRHKQRQGRFIVTSKNLHCHLLFFTVPKSNSFKEIFSFQRMVLVPRYNKKSFFRQYNKKINKYCGLYSDGNVYFDFHELENVKLQSGFMSKVKPKLDSNNPNHRKSLWAFSCLDLTEEDIKFFLDELVTASEIHENQKEPIV